MKFVVDELARISFPKSLRGYSEEDVNDFLKKIRADYRDYDLQLEEKDKEFEAQEKRFIDQHKVKRREFDQALQELSNQLERNKNQIARLEAEAQRLPSGDLEFRLDQALGNLAKNQAENEGLRTENAGYQAQLEALKNVRPAEITTILTNVQGLADSVLQDAERKRAQILAEARASVVLSQQEAEKQKAAIYQQAEREQTEVRKAFEKDRSQELSELALVNQRVKEKETELAETGEKLQALNLRLAELSQNKEASQAELNQVRDRAEDLRQQLINQFNVVIEILKNEEI